MVVNTKRLALRPFEMRDTALLAEAFGDPETMRFMHVLPHQNPEQTVEFFKNEIGFGADYWTITWNGGDVPLGIIHFLAGARVPGMGYLVRREFWGRGIATEAMGMALGLAFEQKNLDRAELWINEGNAASQRVAEKLGFRLKGRIHQRYDWEENHHIMLTYGLWAGERVKNTIKPAKYVPQFFAAYPVLAASDVQASVRFYCEQLGFEVDFLVGDPPVHVGLGRGNWSSDSAYIQIVPVREGETVRPQGWLYIMVEAQIDKLYEEYQANGVEIVNPPQTHPWGMREFSIQDPDGHELRFGTRQAG